MYKPHNRKVRLRMLPLNEYRGVDDRDPIRFYNLPLIGRIYQQRVEYCLGELDGGVRILEIGFGSGVSFLNLKDDYQEIHGLDLTANVKEISTFFKSKGINAQLLNGNVLSLPYSDNTFDAVLMISVLEHLTPTDLNQAFKEINRILIPGGQAVYGVPVERPFMVNMFKLLGTNIREHHFSTEREVYDAANLYLKKVQIINMTGPLGFMGQIYEVGHFQKEQ